MNIRFSNSIQELFKYHASNTVTPKGVYYFLPYWFRTLSPEETPDHSTHEYFEMLPLSSLPDDLKEGIQRHRGVVDKPITKEFLLSKGYMERAHGRLEIERTGRDLDVTIFFSWDGDIMTICNNDNPHDYTLYSGAVPTESQYEVLNQLLKLHE